MWDKNNIYYNKLIDSQINYCPQFKLQSLTKDNRALIQKLCLKAKLPIHRGCVNTVTWNKSGQYILSGSDDQHLCITDAYTNITKTSIQTGHRSNIFSAKYLPNSGDRNIVSCSGDGAIILTDIEKPQTSRSNIFNCHFGTTYDLVTIPNDSNTFISCGEDATVRWFDIRVKSSCWKVSDCKEDILINSIYPVTAIAINHLTPYLLATGSADGNAYLFDRRMLATKLLGVHSDNSLKSVLKRFKAISNDSRNHRITSLCFSPDGEEILISYSWDFIYLFNIKDEGVPVQVLKEKSLRNNESHYDREPSIRRVRVRGDWSDTGPSARPENERTNQSNQESTDSNASQNFSSQRPDFILQLSNIVTRIFNVDRERGTRSLLSSLIDASSRRSRLDVQSQPVNSNSESSSSSHLTTTTSNNFRESREAQESTSSFDNVSSFTCSSNKNLKASKSSHSELPNVSQNKIIFNSNVNAKVKKESLDNPSSIESSQSNLRGEESNIEITHCNSNITSNQNQKQKIESQNTFDFLNNQSNQNQGNSSVEKPNTNDIDDSGGMEIESIPQSSSGVTFDSNNQESDSTSDNEKKNQRRRVSDNSNPQLSTVSNSSEENNDNDRMRGRLYRSLDEVIKRFKEKRNEKWISMPSPNCRQKYSGHRNARTMIKKAIFWGNNYVMSGSDCGHIFIWDRYTSELVMILEADCHVVNCVQPHPFDPILASSGIDNDVKLWYPLLSEPSFNEDKANEIIRINEKMLEETKDTVIIPASVIIRMMTSFSNIAQSRGSSRASNDFVNE